MVENELRVVLARKRMSAARLSDKIPDIGGKVCMSFIVNGRVLPTRESMKLICEELECKATDIYDAAELNLNVTEESESVPPQEEPRAQAAETEKHRITISPDDRQVMVPLNSLESPVRIRAEKRKDGHENQERIFFWFELEEKTALVKAVEGLGYRSLTEWFREMYRQTLKQYAALKLDGKTLQELIPPLAQRDSPVTQIS